MLVALLAVCLLGGAAIYVETEGFTVVTTESARRAQIARQPVPIPDAVIQLSSGQQQDLRNFLQADGRTTIVDFIYTRCIAMCLAQGTEFQRLQAVIREQGLSNQIRLLSISFDAADTPQYLARYAQQMRSDPRIWQFAGVADGHQRRALLDTFGIVVVPAELGQFEHNGAYHIVTPDSRLVSIVDLSEPQIVLQQALATHEGT